MVGESLHRGIRILEARRSGVASTLTWRSIKPCDLIVPRMLTGKTVAQKRLDLAAIALGIFARV